MINLLKILFLFAIPATALAVESPVNCAQDPQSQIFDEYQSLSDQEISQRCFYDIDKIEPDASEARKNANPRRASICENGLNKMREISRRYIAKKKEVCLKAKSAPTCSDGSSQTSCVVDAATLSAQVKKGESELSEIMTEGKDRLTKLTKFNRIRTSEFKADMRTLGLMRPEEKNKLARSPKSINDRHRDMKPVPGQVDQPIAAAPDTSTVSKADQTNPTPRSSGISENTPSYRPPSEMRPQDYGAKTLSEYERRLPLLIRQHEETTKQLQKFEEVRVVKHTEHKVAASEMAAKAAQFFATAEKLGYAGTEIAEWKKENPESSWPSAMPAVPAENRARAPSALDSEDELAPAEAHFSGKKETKATATKTDTLETSVNAKEESVPKEEPALSSFEDRLSDDAKTPAAIAERGRLRDLLKRRMQALKDGQSVDELEKVPGSLVGDILAETKAIMGRSPDSSEQPKPGLGTLDVEGALQDIEAQLRELDRQSGILESSSPSLFDRVSAALKKRAKQLR